MESEDLFCNLSGTLCLLCVALCNKIIQPVANCFGVKFFLSILILSFTYYPVFCQDEKLSDIILNTAEQLAADEDDHEIVTLFIENLHELAEKPVMINTADESELSRLFFLSEFQLKALPDHIRETGDIISIYEIASIPGFDRQTAEMMKPFISLTEVINENPVRFKLRNNLLSNFIIKPGDNDTSTLGSAWKILTKYKFTAGSFTGGINIEKDAGERFLPPNEKLPDFYSYHVAWSGKGLVRKIIAGDYSAKFGYGTNVNSRMRTALSLTSSGYISGRSDIKPYTSTDENNFFRGIASELSIANLDLSLFYSKKPVDASLCTSVDSTSMYISNLYNAGLHNNTQLLLKKDVVKETSYGINVDYNISSVRFGVSWTGNTFSIPLNFKGNDPDDLYAFEGIRNSVLSAYYNTLISRILLFGEISADRSWNFAFLQGITTRPADRMTINILYRHYSPEFTSFHAGAPGRNTTTANEYGLLGNFTLEAARYLFISAGCDITYFPWLKYRCSFPSRAKRQEIRIRYIPSDKTSIEILYNNRYSMYDMYNDTGISGISEQTAKAYKGIIRYSPLENLTLTTRFDYKIVETNGSRGILMLQDINYRFGKIPVTVWFRHCIFKTDDWDSRLYTYENDLLYSFSIPALSGTGSRNYLMVKWVLGDIAEFRVKYMIASEKISYNTYDDHDELKFQFRIRF